MAIEKKKARKTLAPLVVSDIQSTATLSAAGNEVIELNCVGSKVSFQGTGTLTGTVEFSLDGINYKDSTAIPASNALGSYATHLVKSVKVTWASGSGRVVVASR